MDVHKKYYVYIYHHVSQINIIPNLMYLNYILLYLFYHIKLNNYIDYTISYSIIRIKHTNTVLKPIKFPTGNDFSLSTGKVPVITLFLLSTKWVDYVEEPMKYQALRPKFFSVGGLGVVGQVVVGWVGVGWWWGG